MAVVREDIDKAVRQRGAAARRPAAAIGAGFEGIRRQL